MAIFGHFGPFWPFWPFCLISVHTRGSYKRVKMAGQLQVPAGKWPKWPFLPFLGIKNDIFDRPEKWPKWPFLAYF